MFEPLEFLPEVTQHIPNKGQHLIRNYSWYSNMKGGQFFDLAGNFDDFETNRIEISCNNIRAHFWSLSENDNNYGAWKCELEVYHPEVIRNQSPMQSGFSVHCLTD